MISSAQLQQALAADERNQFDRERDRVIDLAARKVITEGDKVAKLRRIDAAERRHEERSKPRRGR